LVLFNAAMSGIPKDIFDAAIMDGAGRMATFFRITLPLLWDTIQTAWVYLAILALDAYAIVAVMTAGPGGPDNSTQVMALQISDVSTSRGLILVYIAYSLTFTVFFMHAFFRTLPTSIAEAALVDGASHSTTSFRVMLPMAKPRLISVGIFNVLGQWNQFVLPSFLSPEKPVLSQGIATLLGSQRYENDWGTLFAALTIAMVPVVVVYLIFYRQVQSGLTGATLK
jgi:ABC-type glycerol-3-phosphate transport system permease component